MRSRPTRPVFTRLHPFVQLAALVVVCIAPTADAAVDFPRPKIPNIPRPPIPAPVVPKVNVPFPNIPKPNVPIPNIPRPNVPLPNIPKPNVPKPVIPKPSVPKIDVPKPNVPRPTLPDLSKIDPSKKLKEEFENEAAKTLRSLRKLDAAELQRNLQTALTQRIADQLRNVGAAYDKSSGKLDLRGTRIGTTLSSWLQSFAQGNKRDSRLVELSYHLRSRELTLRLYVRHCQSWGKTIPGLGAVDLYSVTQTALFRYNFASNSGGYEINPGKLGPNITSAAVQKFTEGDLIGATELAAPKVGGELLGIERKNDYEQKLLIMQSRHGAGNVYFASKAFVDWATPETVAKYVANGIITGGAAVYPQIMADLRRRAQEELPRLTAWLQAKGVDNAQTVAQELLTGKTPRWPHLQFDMLPVGYYAREKPLNAVATPWRKVDHLAFVIVWRK